jgi:hypothetical protein
MRAVARAGLPRSAIATGVALILLTGAVATGNATMAEIVGGSVLGLGLGKLVVRIAARWSWLICGLAAADLLIPEDDRYTVIGSSGVGFQLEPYRAIVVFLILGWATALLVDPRVRARTTKFEAPLALLVIAVVGSEITNPSRVTSLSSTVTKGLFQWVCLLLLLYVFVSVIRKRSTLERLVTVLVSCGTVLGIAALIERVSNFNVFNHLHRLLPMMHFDSGAELTALLRNGSFRTIASAGHPIELSTDFAVLTPLAAYLAITRRKAWWGAVLVLLVGNFTTGSRTGIIGLIVVVVVFAAMRPRQTLRCWPALIPMLAVLQLILPNAIGGAINAFFPKGGLLAQQSQVFYAHHQLQNDSRLSRIGPVLHAEFATHNEFFGEGFATRRTGRVPVGQKADQTLDDQWFGTLLETGFLGILGWIWLYARIIRRLGARAKLEQETPEGWLPVALAASVACFATAMFFYDAFSFMQATVMLYILMASSSVLLQLPPVIGPGGSVGKRAIEGAGERCADVPAASTPQWVGRVLPHEGSRGSLRHPMLHAHSQRRSHKY